MSDDLKVFRELLLWLWQTHEKPWEYRHDQAKFIADSYGLAESSLLTDTELEVCLPSEDNVNVGFPDRRYFYLTPVTEGRIMVPRIQLKCDFGRNIPEIRCRLDLFLLDDDLGLQSLGYRFESPEGQNIEAVGVHHYYHIQLIQPPISRIDWLPETQPAFPIDADDPVKLVLGLLISLYGLDYLGTVMREANNVWRLDRYINGIPHTKFGIFEWYRLVEIGDPPRYSEGYTIKSNLNDFDNYIHGKYPGCKIKGITHSMFDALNPAAKKNFP
jgi:hypothetical protein